MRGCFQGVCLPPQSPAPDTQQVLNPGPAILSVSSWMEGSKGGAAVRGVAGVKKRDLGWGVEIPLEAKANRYANTLPEDFSRSHLPAASPGQAAPKESLPVPCLSPRDTVHTCTTNFSQERSEPQEFSLGGLLRWTLLKAFPVGPSDVSWPRQPCREPSSVYKDGHESSPFTRRQPVCLGGQGQEMGLVFRSCSFVQNHGCHP